MSLLFIRHQTSSSPTKWKLTQAYCERLLIGIPKKTTLLHPWLCENIQNALWIFRINQSEELDVY
uniref:Uncharacterized protein n=1 Tax=Anguilla anguilla TaxID=7936 RepID=A0A0E9PSG4_ANGAN